MDSFHNSHQKRFLHLGVTGKCLTVVDKVSNQDPEHGLSIGMKIIPVIRGLGLGLATGMVEMYGKRRKAGYYDMRL